MALFINFYIENGWELHLLTRLAMYKYLFFWSSLVDIQPMTHSCIFATSMHIDCQTNTFPKFWRMK